MERKNPRLEKKEEDRIYLFQQRCVWLCYPERPRPEKNWYSKNTEKVNKNNFLQPICPDPRLGVIKYLEGRKEDG
jgi:hypothetical protein